MVAALASCSQPAPKSAAIDLEGKLITNFILIERGTLGPVRKRQLLSGLQSREGEPYSQDTLDQDIRGTYQTGLIDDIEFIVEPVGDGVQVTAEVSPRATRF